MLDQLAESKAATKKANILLVDDRADGLLALEAILSPENYNLISASSGEQALLRLLDEEFAVILLDVQMPGLDGFETASLIRQNPSTKETPIIFVTAISVDNRHIYKGYESGAVDYIFKPIDSFILKAKVRVFVELFNKNEQIRSQARLLREMELKEKERRLIELEVEGLRRYVDLANAIPHIVVKLDKEGMPEYFNQKWYEYTGMPAHLKKATDWMEAVYPQDRRKLTSLWLRNKRNFHASLQSEIRIRQASDGSYRWHWINAVAEQRNGDTVGWIGTCIDIHERKKYEERLKLLAENLDRSNKELEQFAYAASHDLKEPLHVVSNYAQLLDRRYRDQLDDNGKDFIRYMIDGISRMQELINGLLSYSLIWNKEVPFKEIDCSVCFKNALSNLEFQIKQNDAVITHDPLPFIIGNEVQIIQLFQNLLGNAIKFKSTANPRIHVGVKRKDRQWLFCISDNGIGIKPEYYIQIFQIFKRLHSHREYDGTGIGLATCKKIVENHNGQIWVESDVNKGSEFYFTLPLHR